MSKLIKTEFWSKASIHTFKYFSAHHILNILHGAIIEAHHNIPIQSTVMAIMSAPKKPFSSFPLTIISFKIIASIALLLLTDEVKSREVHFEFSRFDEDTDLIMQGAASFSRNFELQLTGVDSNANPKTGSIGRTFCNFPVPLYDTSTGKVASLFSTFVLNITAPNSTATPGDGITFFIAPFSNKPPNASGGFLGLSSNQTSTPTTNSTTNYVAVEFDTYPNLDIGDPNYRHIGVDINSINSSATVEWEWQSGQPLTVTVTYDPYGKKLRVFAAYPNGKRFSLTHDVDLKSVLPDTVRTGFSGSTGKYSQVNHVVSWYLSSIIEDKFD